MDQAASSNLFSDPNNAMSEFLLNTLQPSLKAEQGVESNESESTMQRSYPSLEPVEFIPETQARLDMPVLAEQYQTMSAEHQESSKNRETEPEQYEDSCAAHIEELKLDNVAIQNTAQTKDSYSGRKKKMGSTRKSLRVMRDNECIQEPTTEKTTPNSELINAKKGTLNLNTEIAHQSIQTLSQPIYVIEPEREKTGLTYKNREEGQEKNEDRDPRNVGDIDRESLKSKAIEDMVNSDLNLCGKEVRIQDYELPIHLKPDPSEGSLLSEIELYLNKNTLNTATTTTTNLNIPELSEPMSEGSLQLSSQNPKIHLEPNSPARRKMGSSRKMSKNKHTEKISDEGGASEQENLNFKKNNVKNSEPKTEAKTDMDTVMAESTEESVEVMSEVQAISQIKESSTQASGQPLPEVRRKFGSRRTTNGRSGLGAFTHDDYESNQKNTDVQATKDGKMVSDPELIKEPESTAISQPVSEKRPGIDEVTTTTVDDTNVSTEAGLVSLDDLEKSSLFVVSTGGKPKIDFEQWNEQLPEFEEVVYNIVMVGNSSVGKTSFIKRLQNGQFIPDYSATIGVDTFVQTIQFGNRTVKLYVWDTAGQERYHSITKQVFNKAQGLLLMYDITSSQSFHAIRSWISQVQEKAPPEVILMLLGNKNDCAHREVQLQEGENLAKEYDIHFMECSAATGENVLDSMKTLAWLLVKQRVRKVDEYTTLQPKPQNKKSGCC
ncbi:ras and EF-hand domain-containing protein homolog isoform X1 [Silurus meridionalis]|uniref:ras and EF-hand domain-containing protein homolog isoform X1 n=1 Tax=Silurus meridionalis TaxID=175797 RepID=UPI001EEA0A82|nr:ras and EF-hand domain-containing protein homolog isoform X1 [Silurus meridionalis]